MYQVVLEGDSFYAGLPQPTNVRSHMPGGVFHTSSSGLIALKTPRDRVMLSARASREMEKLPPPPVGRTMGHG